MRGVSSSKLRSAQIFGMSLTEMILILLFFMFLVAKNAFDSNKSGATLSASCQKQLQSCSTELAKTKTNIDLLKAETEKLKQMVSTLLNALGKKPLPVTDPHFMYDAEKKLPGGLGAAGRPRCLAGNNYLLELVIEDGYVTSRQKWGAEDAGTVNSTKAIQELVNSGRIKFKRFEQFAEEIFKSRPDCIFTVLVEDRTTRKDTYKPQLLSIERYFGKKMLN